MLQMRLLKKLYEYAMTEEEDRFATHMAWIVIAMSAESAMQVNSLFLFR